MARSTGSGPAGSNRSQKPGREKHIAFFRLLDACGEPECPVCHLVRRRVEQYFDGLLYEKVNDPEIRKRFRAAGGFCNPHSFQFMSCHDGLAASILYRDLLATWLKRPAALPVPSRSGLLPGCPACREKARAEDACLSLLVEFLEDEQLKTALLSSDGLCLPHLSGLAERLRGHKQAIPDWLMEFQRSLTGSIVAALSTYLDSCNYSLGRERPQLSREQELAWKRAVRKSAGFPAAAED